MIKMTKKMKKYIVTTMCSMAVLGGMGVSYVKAQTSTILFVAPHRIVIAPDQKIQVINVANKSDETRRYAVSKVDQVMNERGLTEQKETFEFSAKRMIRAVPARFTLKAGERQTIRVMARRDDQLAAGDYHSHLLFKEVPLTNKDKAELEKDAAEAKKKIPDTPEPGGASFEIKALYGVAVPIIVQHGEIASDIKMTSAQVLRPEDGQEYLLDMRFQRGGNAEAAGFLSAEYVAGDQVVDLVPKQWVRMYREVTEISKNLRLRFPEDQNYSQGKIIVTFDRGYSDAKGQRSDNVDQVTIPFP